jgi:branched-chain amino acid transport system substrate-binding protein
MAFHQLFASAALAAGIALAAGPASAQTVKVGFVSSMSGPNAILGEYMEKGARLYMALNADKLPPGVKIELLVRDDTGPNPDKAKQLTQELIVRDKVQILTGYVFSPNGMAIAPLITEAKVPTVIMNAAASQIMTLSPYYIRTSFGTWQAPYPLGQWAAKNFKRVYIAVSDFAAGHDSEHAFEQGFKDANGGGEIVGRVRMPLNNPDFVPFMQKIKDTRPDALFSFVPGGRQATQIMKAFGDLGLKGAGVKFIGTGDITSDEVLPTMGDTPLGVITAHHYSAAADRPSNKAFLAAWRKAYGEDSTPSFLAVGAWDGMAAIYEAVAKQNGKVTPEKTMEILRSYKTDNSPRGPFKIDQKTGDIMQNEYLREVRSVDGKLVNVEIETIGEQVLDPWLAKNAK